MEPTTFAGTGHVAKAAEAVSAAVIGLAATATGFAILVTILAGGEDSTTDAITTVFAVLLATMAGLAAAAFRIAPPRP